MDIVINEVIRVSIICQIMILPLTAKLLEVVTAT